MDPKSVKGRPWAKQPNETVKAYDAFVTYLELGKDRSIVKALKASGKPAGSLRWWEEWSSTNRWVKRADEYDSDHLEDKIRGRAAQREKVRQPTIDDAPDMLLELRELSQGYVRPGKTAKVKTGRDGKPVKVLVPDPHNEGEFMEVGVLEDAVNPKVRAQILETLLGMGGIMKPIRTELAGPDGKELGGQIRDGLRNIDPTVLAIVAAAFGVET